MPTRSERVQPHTDHLGSRMMEVRARTLSKIKLNTQTPYRRFFLFTSPRSTHLTSVFFWSSLIPSHSPVPLTPQQTLGIDARIHNHAPKGRHEEQGPFVERLTVAATPPTRRTERPLLFPPGTLNDEKQGSDESTDRTCGMT